MRILVIDDNDPFRHFLVTTLENHLRSIDIVEATSLKVAKMLYASDPYFECILLSLDMDTGTALSFVHHVQSISTIVSIITLSSQNQHEIIPGTNFLKKETGKNKPAKIFSEALINLEVFQKELSHNSQEKSYAQIKIFYLWRFEELPFDLYVKINEKKYVKVLTKNTRYDEDFIEKYHTKHNEYLYLENKNYPLLENLLYNDYWFEDMNDLSEEDKNYRMKKIIQYMAYSIGLTPHLIIKAEEVVQSAIINVNQSMNLRQLYNKRQKGASFQANVSTLMSYITSALCDELKWTTNSSKEKLVFAAIFQDTSLKSSKLSSLFYLNLDELNKLGLDDSQKKEFFNHAQHSAQMAREINRKFPQVEDIICHHHERPDGSGFPKGLNYQKLPPLSCLFIVAHDYIMRCIMSHFEMQSSDILKEMASNYQLGHFKKCFRALEKILD